MVIPSLVIKHSMLLEVFEEFNEPIITIPFECTRKDVLSVYNRVVIENKVSVMIRDFHDLTIKCNSEELREKYDKICEYTERLEKFPKNSLYEWISLRPEDFKEYYEFIKTPDTHEHMNPIQYYRYLIGTYGGFISSFTHMCMVGNLEVSKWLYYKNNDMSISLYTNIAFNLAMEHNRINIVKWMYEEIGGFDLRGNGSDDLMKQSMINGNTDVILWMLDKVYKTNPALMKQWLDYAIVYSHKNIVKELIDTYRIEPIRSRITYYMSYSSSDIKELLERI